MKLFVEITNGEKLEETKLPPMFRMVIFKNGSVRISEIHVKVIKINTLITPLGDKKAFIKLHPDNSAQDIAIDLGIF